MLLALTFLICRIIFFDCPYLLCGVGVGEGGVLEMKMLLWLV